MMSFNELAKEFGSEAVEPELNESGSEAVESALAPEEPELFDELLMTDLDLERKAI